MPSAAPYRFEIADSHAELVLLPAMDESEWGEIERVGTGVLKKLETLESPALLINLTHLNYMSSAMVALIVRLWKAINARSGQIVIVNQDELIQEILALAGLTEVWTIVETRKEGLTELNVNDDARTSTALTPLYLAIAAGVAAGVAMAIIYLMNQTPTP